MEWSDILGFFSKTTPGSVGIWVIVLLGLAAWWKGLPSVIEAITNRQSKIEERMEARLKQADERFAEQITAADGRHADCVRETDRLRQRVNDQDQRIEHQAHRITELEEQVSAARDQNEGLKRQIVQMQVSTLRVTPDAAPDGIMAHMLEQLDKVTTVKR